MAILSYEFIEGGTSNVGKNGVVQTGTIYESGISTEGAVIGNKSYSYKPAANTNNSCMGGFYVDYTKFEPGSKVIIELDFIWSDIGVGEGGTFSAAFQGIQRKLNGTDEWANGSIITSALTSNTNPGVLMKNSASGFKHYCFETTMIASVMANYQGQNVDIRVNYANGIGTITISNLKIYPANQGIINECVKIGDTFMTTNNFIEI